MRRRLVLASSLLVVLAAWATTATDATAKPRVTAQPNPIPFGEKQTVEGRGWPVIEFCSRTVRLSLRSDQNAFRIGRDRVNTRRRFRFTWIPRRRDVGRGDWTLVARMRCESGKDGSPNPVRATTPIRIGAANFVVGRGRTPKARWTLYTRRGRFGGFCTGVRAGPLGEQGRAPSGGGCGGGLRGKALDLGAFYGRHRGTFAFGTAAPDVARVQVTFGAGKPMEARLLPSPPVLGFTGRFWIAPFPGQCFDISARAFDAEDKSLGRVEIPHASPHRVPRPPPPSSSLQPPPPPSPTADCPKAP